MNSHLQMRLPHNLLSIIRENKDKAEEVLLGWKLSPVVFHH